MKWKELCNLTHLKINKNLLMKIASYLCPNAKNEKKRKLIEYKIKKAIKIKSHFSGFCYGRYHFVVVDNEIVEFFIVGDGDESKYSLLHRALSKERNCVKEISLKIVDSNKNIWSSKQTKEINFRVNKDSLVVYKKDIKPDYYIWTDGSFIEKDKKGYSSYVISDLKYNVLYQDAIKMEKAMNANDAEVFALVLALNKIQEIGLIGPTLITDSYYAFSRIVDRDSEIRKNIDKKYGKENVETMLTNFKNKNRLYNKAHNLLEDKSTINNEISINEMISMGYALKEIPKQQEVTNLKTISIPRIVTKPENVIIPNMVSIPKGLKFKEVVMERWFSKLFIKNREISRFEKRNKLKVSSFLFKYLKENDKNKSDKEILEWLENFINKSIEFKKNDKRYLFYQRKMIIIWDNEIKYYEERAKIIKREIESVTKKIIV
jgi:ribonuclease HI